MKLRFTLKSRKFDTSIAGRILEAYASVMGIDTDWIIASPKRQQEFLHWARDVNGLEVQFVYKVDRLYSVEIEDNGAVSAFLLTNGFK